MAQTFLRFRQWHMLCVLPLFLLLLAGCTQDVYDMPPTVLINGENYRLANVVYEKLPEANGKPHSQRRSGRAPGLSA